MKDLKSLRNEAELLRRQEYLKKFGSIKGHLIENELTDRELEDFY